MGIEWYKLKENKREGPGFKMTITLIPPHRRTKQKTHKSVSPYKHASLAAIVAQVGQVIASYR